MISRFMSPYHLNPFDIDPMRDLLNEIVDFERVRRQQAVKLFLCATAVRTGKIAIFKNEEITADHVLASACMPFRMQVIMALSADVQMSAPGSLGHYDARNAGYWQFL